ncbi:MAG: hypothetical protein WBE11_18105, partial [Candidatus Aminicenantaceae bacterium]
MKHCFQISVMVLIVTFSTLLLSSQESQSLKLLALKKAQLQVEMTKGELDRAMALKEKGLISEQEFVQKRTVHLQAQVSYQESLISFMGSEARISVASAVKYQDNSG